MSPHLTCTSCPNHPNYYWSQALDCHDQRDWDGMWTYIWLYTIAVMGD